MRVVYLTEKALCNTVLPHLYSYIGLSASWLLHFNVTVYNINRESSCSLFWKQTPNQEDQEAKVVQACT